MKGPSAIRGLRVGAFPHWLSFFEVDALEPAIAATRGGSHARDVGTSTITAPG